MTLNRKYAALPDLDSAPDIYETPELTDDNSTAPTGRAHSNSTSSSYKDFDEADDDSAGISRSHLHPDEARTLFSPAQIDARDVDFSDRVTAKRKSYKASTRRQKILQDGTEGFGDFSDEEDGESLERKIARLKREIEEVKDELGRRQADKSQVKQGHGKVEEEDIRGLSQVLRGLSADQGIALRKTGDITISTAGLHTQDDPQSSPALGLPGTFPFTGTDSGQHSQALAKAADFDSRLTLLEKALGLSTISTPAADSNGMPKAILPTLDTLQQQISVLSKATPSSLDSISRQVRTLTQEAERLEESRKAAKTAQDILRAASGDVVEADSEDSEQVAKINALYGTLPTIDNLAPMLPLLLDRLRSLRAVHAEAATASQTLDNVEQKQAEMAEDIRKWREGLEKVEEAVKRSETITGGNMKTVEGWVRELEKKMAEL